jgi:hypothetical protein
MDRYRAVGCLLVIASAYVAAAVLGTIARWIVGWVR